ncbi:ribonuclease T2 [Paracoccus sp. EGI L200073]|nr:ribonuclease T2 [Paracoccus salsus]MCF3973380.1 ribonuclease T2 [Paracoccus salsus]
MTRLPPLILIALMALMAPGAHAADVAGRFDYYVLSLSWSPSWCRAEGDDRDAAQCDRGRNTGFVVHGLWPQYERGWPQDCATAERDPSRRETAQMADLMGSGGIAWYQWQKHGRCSGLSAAGYFAATREAAAAIAIPAVFEALDRDIRLPPGVVEEAFVEANPGLERDGITISCRNEALHEVRICLSRDLMPRLCADDIRRDCARPAILMERVR